MGHELSLVVILALLLLLIFQTINLRRRLDRFDIDRLEQRLSDLAFDIRRVLREGKAAPPATPAKPESAPATEPPTTTGEPTPPPIPAASPTYTEILAATRPAPAAAVPEPPPPLVSPASRQPPEPPSRLAQSVRDILQRIWQWLLVGEEYRPKGVTMEFAIATTWLVRAGIVALVFGVGFFLKWSIDRNLLGPAARVAMSIVFGLGLLGIGLRLLGKRWNLLGQGFTGGGLAILYFSMYALGPLYKLVDSVPMVFGLMILVTVTAGVLALYANSMLVAIFGIVGGFLTPLLLHTDTPNLAGLYGYLILLNLGILGLGHARQWRLLNYLGFVFTWLLYAASLKAYQRPDFPVTLSFLCAFFAIQSTLTFLYNLRRGIASTVLEIIHLALNAAMFSVAAYFLIRSAAGRPWPALMTLGLALYYVAHVAVFLRLKLKDRALLVTLIALAGGYTTLTMPLAMERESLTIAWAVQALMFVWLGQRLRSHFLRQLGYGVYAITLWRLLAFEFPRFDVTAAAHTAMSAYWNSLGDRLWTFGLSIASVAAAYVIERRAALSPPEEPEPDIPDILPADVAWRACFGIAVLVLFAYLHVELFTMFGYWLPWRPAALTLLWCAAGASFLMLYLATGSPVHLAVLGLFAAGAAAKTLLFDMAAWDLCPGLYFGKEWGPLPALARWLGLGAVLALLATAWRGTARRTTVPAGIFGYTALALLWLYATLELGTFLKWRLPTFRAGGVSVLWTLFALAFVAGGIWRNTRTIRLAGLLLFAVVIAKVFLLDLRHMPPAFRVIAFMAVGALLLLGSFVYLRASRKFTTGGEAST